jgi:cobalt-zinc-cadmium efflux system membrane fusion protein
MELIKIIRTSLLLMSAGLISCAGNAVKEKTDEPGISSETAIVRLSPEQVKNAGIRIESPVMKEVMLPVQVSGVLDVPPQNLHSIGARVPGMIKSTTLLQGSHVHKGDVLCVLENPEFLNWQQEYMGNRAKLEMLAADLKRQQGLAEKNLASQKVLQQAAAEFQMLEAVQNALRKKLRLTGFSIEEIERGNFTASLPVTAPSDGFVTSVFINTGQVVAEGASLCELVNVEHIHAELMVFEKDISRVKEGQAVEFELVSSPGKVHKASVFMINHKISRERTVQVHAHLEEMKPEFMPNMQVTARILTGGHKEWTVPASSLVSFAGRSAIYAEDAAPGTFKPIPVEVLNSVGNFVALKFPEGTDPASLKVVAEGAYDLKSVAEKSAAPEE